MAAVFAATAVWGPALAQGADPYASNNGVYPAPAEWSGPLRTLNYDYPEGPVSPGWKPGGPSGGEITTANADAYLDALKAYVAPSMKKMVEQPDAWDPKAEGWYGMIWTGASGDPCEGRDAILGAFSGQVILQDCFAESGLTTDMQNFTVIYYDAVAATMLARLWADPFHPAVNEAQFPEGSIVIKAAAVTPTEKEWPVLEGSSTWHVYRPKFIAPEGRCVFDADLNPSIVQDLRVLQFDVIVKDSVASPETGWVFSTFLYDKDAPGQGTWDRLVALGAQWGNDPEYADEPDGNGPNGELDETWINPDAPKYALHTLGWGGRLSGPIDVSQRHNVSFVGGGHTEKIEASSCMSCHSTAQFPFTANLYPSPNIQFPPEGRPFLMYDPGSAQWARWYENRGGAEPLSPNTRGVGLDYDMLITFAIGTVNAVIGETEYTFEQVDVH